MSPVVAVEVLALGSGGSLLRHLAGRRPRRLGRQSSGRQGSGRQGSGGQAGEPWVWGILAVNVLGSAIAGLVVGSGAGTAAQLVAVGGFCGGLTTYGTWALQVVRRAVGGRRARAVALAVGTAGACVLAARLGIVVGRGLR